ncbi:unnamed protein product [Lupinus luteus]|uniref:Uncharacterized protein n=1 Tax=Lupinus luteus TaxID=3873 RepID=A0AAV1WAC7_LUPLU
MVPRFSEVTMAARSWTLRHYLHHKSTMVVNNLHLQTQIWNLGLTKNHPLLFEKVSLWP